RHTIVVRDRLLFALAERPSVCEGIHAPGRAARDSKHDLAICPTWVGHGGVGVEGRGQWSAGTSLATQDVNLVVGELVRRSVSGQRLFLDPTPGDQRVRGRRVVVLVG